MEKKSPTNTDPTTAPSRTAELKQNNEQQWRWRSQVSRMRGICKCIYSAAEDSCGLHSSRPDGPRFRYLVLQRLSDSER